MNLRTDCPDIPDHWRGGVNEACRVLGKEGKPLDRSTLRKYALLGRAGGGLDPVKPRGGGNTKRKMVFTGKELKRFWRLY